MSVVHPLGATAAALYVVVGLAVAVLLGRRGHATATALGAIACWPLFVPLLGRRAVTIRHGPLHERITAALAALREAMDDPAAAGFHLPADLDALVDDLHRADERLAMVDGLLASVVRSGASAAPGVEQSIAQLRRARATTTAEIEAVLDGVVQLRLQIGLRSLAGNSVPVQERLRDLRHRLAAIDELAAMELHA